MKNLLKQNVGPLDRVIRVLAGVVLVTLATLVADDTVRVIFLILSIPLLFSGITGFCPTYTLFRISTAFPRSQMMSKMLQAGCSAREEFPSYAPMMKYIKERLNDYSWGDPPKENNVPEGRE